jgi:hypothetical protein
LQFRPTEADLIKIGGTEGTPREMRNHNDEDHKFASILTLAYIYDFIIATISGMATFLRLPNS